MKRYALVLSFLGILVLAPTSAFANDKEKDYRKYQERQAQMVADRITHGWYNRPCEPVEQCAPHYYVPERHYRDWRDCDPRGRDWR